MLMQSSVGSRTFEELVDFNKNRVILSYCELFYRKENFFLVSLLVYSL